MRGLQFGFVAAQSVALLQTAQCGGGSFFGVFALAGSPSRDSCANMASWLDAYGLLLGVAMTSAGMRYILSPRKNQAFLTGC